MGLLPGLAVFSYDSLFGVIFAALGCRLLVVESWVLMVRCLLLVVGRCRVLIVDFWLLVIGGCNRFLVVECRLSVVGCRCQLSLTFSIVCAQLCELRTYK
jgi:hypothetical protein